MNELIEKDEASLEREKQRSESEARDIIHDLDRLYTYPEEKKTRWVWELLQNAKDVATSAGVTIHFKLTPDKLEFKHDGLPFKTKHLLAILYKTSTKSLNGDGGTTGKYGTGFVTTHVLNKKLNISGVHENEDGKRRFNIEIDRTSANVDEDKALQAMQQSLAKTFLEISSITKIPAQHVVNNFHTFSYPLKPESFVYAERGLLELERNLAFTLLINPKIKSVTIEAPSWQKSYSAIDEETTIDGIRFISLESQTGLLYLHIEKLLFGIPAIKLNDTYRLLPIDKQAVLFKEFPLIGSEGFNLPVFIQHQDFHPTEQRDGIRTKIISKDEEDPTSNKNRAALVEFVSAYTTFMEKLMKAKVIDTFIFAKSGLPAFVDNYSNIDWFETNIQKPIREFILKKKVVETCSGTFVEIANAKFLVRDIDENEAFYNLAAKLIPDQIPIKSTVWQWADIISQEHAQWPANIIFTIDDLVRLVSKSIKLDNDESFQWLKELYEYLDNNNLGILGEKHPIYPNESGNFCLRDQVAVHPVIDDEFKIVSKGLGRPLDEEFLNRKVGNVTAIKSFDLSEFYNHLNKDVIGDLKIEEADEDEIKAIFHICSLFKSDKAFKRETWFQIIKQFLPGIVPNKKIISVDYENYWRSAELWSIKYICYLIEQAKKPTRLAEIYFEGNEKSCFDWVNDFLGYVFGLQEDSKEVILKRHIIPTQIDEFKSYDDFIYAEQDSKYFDDTIKDIYKDFTDKGNPRRNIIDTRLLIDGIKQREVDVITKEIDKLFHDPNIESKVKKGGIMNQMFMQLSSWYDQFPNAALFLPKFSDSRPYLNILALGEGFSKQIMEIQSSGKSIEDITELAKIRLSANEMKLFESAAAILGTSQLLAKAQEMLDAKKQIDRWKTIGTAAETAFKETLSQAEPNFEILNPDIGKDFVILVNGKEYAIEIKSVDPLKGNVNMSILQGKTAVIEKDCYALCVLSRPDDDKPVDKDYFIQEARFVPDIGYRIGNSIELWNQGLSSLDTNGDVKVILDDKIESVYISRGIWKSNVSFDGFVQILKNYFTK